MIFRLSFFAPPPEINRRWLAPGLAEVTGDPFLARGAQRAGVAWQRAGRATVLLALCGLLTSCPVRRAEQSLGVLQRVSVPAQVLGNLFVVDVKIGRDGPFRFLIDTGSSISLVSQRVAQTLRRDEARLIVRTPAHGTVTLPSVTLPRAALGRATLVDVRAGVHEFGEISDQLGVRVDGVLGLPVFRDVLLTLDYPGRRLVLDPRGALDAGRDAALRTDYGAGVPLTRVRIGARDADALLDSGSDGGLALDADARTEFVAPLRPGPVRATLAGDYQQQVGRLAADLEIGVHAVREPVVEVVAGVSSIGGDILKNFAVTFDQRRELVALRREGRGEPLRSASPRSIGLSFLRRADAWVVATVIAGTPANALPVATGDVCVRLNGEPMAAWPIDRFNALLRTSDRVTFCVRGDGAAERELVLPVVDLVP